jgi:glycosyltransferase involved in cell wall biosynthesis
MRVGLLYVDAQAEGGYPRDVRALAGHLAGLGATVTLVTEPGPRTDGLEGVEVARPDRLGWMVSAFDILHVWGVFLPNQLRMTRRVAGETRLVISPMGHLIRPHVRRKRWKKVPYLRAIRPIVARWRATAHLFSEVEREGARRYLRPAMEFEASLGIFPAPPGAQAEPAGGGDYLLFIGRNDVYQKGMDLLLGGYASAVGRGLDMPLRIAGQPAGNSTQFLRRQIKSLGLSGRVELVGPVSEQEKWRLLRQARCLVFLSRWDGPPRPIREAISVGTPVLVSPGTNLHSLVNETGAGAGVAFQRDAVARGLVQSGDEATVETWRDGAERLRHVLDWSTVARRYLEGYRSVAGGKGPEP